MTNREETLLFSKKLPQKTYHDVVVAGGGVAGVAAAVSAAKRGKSVLLLEKTDILGGLATLGLVNFFVPMCNGRGKQIIFGLAEKWLRDSVRYGFDTLPKSWKNGEPEKPTMERYCTQYSPYLFAMQLMEEVTSLGIDLLYDCTAAEPVMDGCRCTGVVTVSKSGLTFSPCGVLIDTTGDSDLLRAAGVRTAERGNFFTYYGRAVTLRGCKKAWETGNIREVYSTRSGGMINLFGDNQPDNVPLWHGTAAEDVTDYLIKNQKKMLAALKEEDRLSRDMAWMPGMPQFRTTCRICGEYTFTVKDAYRHHTDSICAINDFEHRDHLFEVPYGCLYQKEFPNLLTAGRSASGDGYGWDLLRVIPPAILTGQAAGEAASLALESKTSVSGVSVPLLQKRLEERNVMIHFPDEYVPEDKTVVIHGKNADGHAEGHI